MSPHYKLIYFDIKGLGECIKYILEYKKIKYESEVVIHFTGKGPWAELKPTMPFGQLPVLEIDGKRLYQSMAICQYLANEYGLITGDSFEDAHLVAIGGAIQDLLIRVARFYYEKNQEVRAQLKIDWLNRLMPFYFERFEKILKAKGDFFAGKVTWIDFYMVAALEAINGMMEKNLVAGTYPALEAHMHRVWNLPNIKEYVAVRPPYPR